MYAVRKGATAKEWSDDPGAVKLRTLPHWKHGKVVALDFWMPSKGGGDTDVQVAIAKDDFGAMLEFMSKVDTEALTAAIAVVLKTTSDPTLRACGVILAERAELSRSADP